MPRRAFTLVEILAMGALMIVVFSTMYKLFVGTWGSFHKNQSKLTNLRAASIMLEFLKHDLRLATVPSDDASKHQIIPSGDNTGTFKFQILGENSSRKMVTYTFDGKAVNRAEDGGGSSKSRVISLARVNKFKIEEEGKDPYKGIKITVEVDNEKSEDGSTKPTTTSKNKVNLTAVVYPRFFHKFANQEEEYWAKARAHAGGVK